MLITFTNSLDTDQGRHNVDPDLDPNHVKVLIVVMKEFFEKANLKKNSR